jgi:hypothetical protein
MGYGSCWNRNRLVIWAEKSRRTLLQGFPRSRQAGMISA